MYNNTAVSKPDSRDISSLLERIVLGEYVVIIGDDVILDKDYHDGEINKLIVDTIKAQEEIGELEPNDDLSYKYRFVLNECIDYSLDNINPDIKKLLKTRCFPIVITTSTTLYLEKLMYDIWGEDLIIKSIYDLSNDVDLTANYEFGTKPILYYAFGRCKDAPNSFVKFKDENDMMAALTRWINEYSPKKFKSYIWDKQLMSIGCTFADWYFRFLWFTMTGAFDKVSRLSDGRIYLTLENGQTTELGKYLRKKANVTAFYDARESLQDLTSLVCIRDADDRLIDSNISNMAIQRYRDIIDKRSLGGIFISYAHEDFEFAEQLFHKLKNEGLQVWFDNNNLPYADNVGYPKRVSNALKQMSVFVPILSNQTIKDILNNNNRCYIEDEWKQISKGCKIAPVCIQKYKASSNEYHLKVKQIIPSFEEKVAQVFYANSEDEGTTFRRFIEDLKS